MKPKLEYTSMGRYGYVLYKDNEGELRFYYEFGGGNVVAIINVPSTDEWVKETNRSLAKRDEILTFVAEHATKDQVRDGHYQIKESWIEIMTR